jgi:predicted dehydrogenase
MAHFLSCIETGEPPAPDAAEGLAIMRILDAAYESARREMRADHQPPAHES